MKPHQTFDKWVQDSYLTNGEVATLVSERARSMDVDPKKLCAENVRGWRAGDYKPQLRMRPVIEKVTKSKVKAASWRK